MKTTPGDIIVLHICTKNYNQMMYDFWDIVRNRRKDKRTDRQIDGQTDGKSDI